MIQIADDNLGEEFLKNVMEETTLKKNQKKIVEDYLFSRHEMLEEEIRKKEYLQNVVNLRKNGFMVEEDIQNPFD